MLPAHDTPQTAHNAVATSRSLTSRIWSALEMVNAPPSSKFSTLTTCRRGCNMGMNSDLNQAMPLKERLHVSCTPPQLPSECPEASDTAGMLQGRRNEDQLQILIFKLVRARPAQRTARTSASLSLSHTHTYTYTPPPHPKHPQSSY
eukprot:25044-Pelagomonas_calceolata.AAC.2